MNSAASFARMRGDGEIICRKLKSDRRTHSPTTFRRFRAAERFSKSNFHTLASLSLSLSLISIRLLSMAEQCSRGSDTFPSIPSIPSQIDCAAGATPAHIVPKERKAG